MNRPNSFYSNNGNSKGALIIPDKGAFNITSPTTNKVIKLTQVTIPAAEVMGSIEKCRFNKRSLSSLTPAAVLDILADIRTTKRNSNPVLAVKLPNGKYEIIAGIRRCFAVSLCPDASVVIHYADAMDEEDKRYLAKTSDVYRAPSIIDFGLTLLEYKAELDEGAFSVRAAAEVFGENKTRVSEAIRAAELPTELLDLFPALEYISRTFLRRVTANSVTNEQILSVISDMSPLRYTEEDLLAENADILVKLASEKLESLISKRLDGLKAKPAKSQGAVINSPWNGAHLVNGATAKVTPKNVTLVLDAKLANSESGRALLNLLIEK